MNRILELREKRAKAWDAAKKFLDAKTGPDGLVSAEDSATYDKMEADVLALGKEVERLERQAAIDAALNAAANQPITEKPGEKEKAKAGLASAEYAAAFWQAIRSKSVPHEVFNALETGTDSEGGYLVPDEYQRTLIDALQEQNIFRQLAHVITTTSGERKIPVVASHGTAAWIDEEGSYKGDAILQKTFCTDFLTKKMKVNEGEVPQYYVENSHPAIISPEMFEAVQAELAKRKRSNHRNYTPHCFSGRIFCDECGALYGSKVWNSATKYKAMVWQCNNKHLNHAHCSTPSLRNETVEDGFIMAINQLLKNKDEIIRLCEKVMNKRCDISGLEDQKAKLQAELEVTCGLMERLIAMNAATAMDQDEYNRQFAEYEARYNETRQRIADVESEQKQRIAKRGKLAEYLETLRNQGLISSFNETLWYGTVEQVRVTTEGNLCFIFRDGQEITV